MARRARGRADPQVGGCRAPPREPRRVLFTLDPRRSRRSRRSRAGASGAATPTPTRSSDPAPSRCSRPTPPPVTRRSRGLDSMLPMKPTLAVSVAAVAACALLLVPATGATARPAVPDAVVTTDNETPVLYDDEEGGNASRRRPGHLGRTRPTRDDVDRDRDRQGGRPPRLRPGGRRSSSRSPADARAAGRRRRRAATTTSTSRTAWRSAAASVDLAVVSDRYNDQLRFFAIDPAGADGVDAAHRDHRARAAVPLQPRPGDRRRRAHGLRARGRGSRRPGESYAVVTQEGATNLATVGSRPSRRTGRLHRMSDDRDARRRSPCPTAPPGCPARSPASARSSRASAVDQRTGVLYADPGGRRPLAPAAAARLGASRASSTGSRTSACTTPTTPRPRSASPSIPTTTGFGGDVPRRPTPRAWTSTTGPARTGYVIVSSQGDDTYAVYSTDRAATSSLGHVPRRRASAASTT